MNILESHDYIRCKELLIEWTLLLRQLRKDSLEHTKLLAQSHENRIVSKKCDLTPNRNLVTKMERFAKLVSQQLEHRSFEKSKSNVNLDYIEMEIRLAEFEAALEAYSGEQYNSNW